jgi:hypothetical protein
MAEEKVNSGASTMITIAVFFIATIGTVWYAKTLLEAKNAERAKAVLKEQSAEREVRRNVWEDGYMEGSSRAIRVSVMGTYAHLIGGSNINWVAGDIQSNCIAGLTNNPYR